MTSFHFKQTQSWLFTCGAVFFLHRLLFFAWFLLLLFFLSITVLLFMTICARQKKSSTLDCTWGLMTMKSIHELTKWNELLLEAKPSLKWLFWTQLLSVAYRASGRASVRGRQSLSEDAQTSRRPGKQWFHQEPTDPPTSCGRGRPLFRQTQNAQRNKVSSRFHLII